MSIRLNVLSTTVRKGLQTLLSGLEKMIVWRCGTPIETDDSTNQKRTRNVPLFHIPYLRRWTEGVIFLRTQPERKKLEV